MSAHCCPAELQRQPGALSAAELLSLRRELGLTQAQAARAFGVVTNSWARWERGEMGIDPGYAFEIANVLDRIRRTTRSSLTGLRDELLAGRHARARRPRKSSADAAATHPPRRDSELQTTILEILTSWQTLHASSLFTLLRSKQPVGSEDMQAALELLKSGGYLEVHQDPCTGPRYSLLNGHRTAG